MSVTPEVAGVSAAAGGRTEWLDELRGSVASLVRVVEAREVMLSDDDGVLGGNGAADSVEALALVDRLIGLATSLKATALRAQEASGEWERAGFVSLEAWRARTSKQGMGAAYRDARLARDLGVLGETDEALAAGKISPEAALEISRLRHGGDTKARDEALADGAESRLVKLAEQGGPRDFGRMAKRIGRQMDVNAVEKEHEKVRDRRYLRLRRQGGGLAGEFLVDSVVGDELRRALEAHTPVPARDDERTIEQRAADALADLAKTALDSGVCKNGALVRPHVSVIMREETLAAALQQLGRDGLGENDDAGEDHDQVSGVGVDDATGGDVGGGDVGGGDRDRPSEFELCEPGVDDPLGHMGDPPGPRQVPPIGEVVPLGGKANTSGGKANTSGGEAVRPSGVEDFRERLARERERKRALKVAQDRRRMLDEIDMPVKQFTTPPLLLDDTGLVPAAELEDGTLIPAHVLAAILCDCRIGRVVIDADGQPVDIGRERRTAIQDLRHAALVRDRTCRYPSCTRPARWCDFHHVRAWSKGGVTSLANGLMLCRHHHVHVVHARGVQIVPIAGGFEFYDADGSLIDITYHDTIPAPLGTPSRRPRAESDQTPVRLDTALAPS